MATIDSKSMIDQIIKNNGYIDSLVAFKGEPDNPPAIKIVEYTNAWGRLTWGVVFAGEAQQNRYEIPTNYVNNPRVIWTMQQQPRKRI